MLRELEIAGLGVIEDVALELHEGLNVLTGETGAGKTMVTVGLALALGTRASASLVRPGAEVARVQARFEVPRDGPAAAWAEDGELIVARTVTAEGRGSARLGGQLVPVSTLASVAAHLVEIHGQHEGTGLLSPAAQTAFLDRSAGPAHLSAVQELGRAHERRGELRARLDELERRERDRERELDVLGYQIREIEAAGVRVGELDELEAEATRLSHAERLLERASRAEESLVGDDGAIDRLAAAASDLRGAADLDATALELSEAASALGATAAELARDVRAYRERLSLDPTRLEEVRERLGAVRSLLRKYGDGEEAVLAFLDEARAAADALAGAGQERSRLAAEVAAADERVATLASAVTSGRSRAAPELASAVQAELRELGMPDASLGIALLRSDEVGPGGAERAEFRFAASGRNPIALAKVASGGELSRAMLACRSVLADIDAVPTLVFDEVDAGIGGVAGVAVGRRLARLAGERQVLVVTHLPQIASFADLHLRVAKRGATASVTALDETERVRELTRMLAGLPDSEAGASHAEELLAQAVRAKAVRLR